MIQQMKKRFKFYCVSCKDDTLHSTWFNANWGPPDFDGPYRYTLVCICGETVVIEKKGVA